MARTRRSAHQPEPGQKRFIFTVVMMGLASIFFGMQLMMVGPLKRSLENIQSRLDLTEMDMRKLVSARNQVWQTNDLLTSLKEQHEQLSVARATLAQFQSLQAEVRHEADAAKVALKALEDISGVQEKLIAQASSTQSALKEIDQFLALKASLINDSELTADAFTSLAALQNVRESAISAGTNADVAKSNLVALANIKNSVVNESKDVDHAAGSLKKLVAIKDGITDGTIDVDDAKEMGEKLIALNNQLATDANIDVASKNATQLIAMGSKLAGDLEIDEASKNLTSLVSLQENLSSKSSQIASAVESLEIVSDFRSDIDQHIRSLDGIRRTMTEIVMLETTVGRAARILRPLVELGNLRRLSDGEIRQAARAILADRTMRLSQKKSDLQGAPSLKVDPPKENLVPQPRDLEIDEDN